MVSIDLALQILFISVNLLFGLWSLNINFVYQFSYNITGLHKWDFVNLVFNMKIIFLILSMIELNYTVILSNLLKTVPYFIVIISNCTIPYFTLRVRENI